MGSEKCTFPQIVKANIRRKSCFNVLQKHILHETSGENLNTGITSLEIDDYDEKQLDSYQHKKNRRQFEEVFESVDKLSRLMTRERIRNIRQPVMSQEMQQAITRLKQSSLIERERHTQQSNATKLSQHLEPNILRRPSVHARQGPSFEAIVQAKMVTAKKNFRKKDSVIERMESTRVTSTTKNLITRRLKLDEYIRKSSSSYNSSKQSLL